MVNSYRMKKLGSFKSAMQALLDGEKVRYIYWPRDRYIVINDEGRLVTQHGSDFIIDEHHWKSEREWEIFEESRLGSFKYAMDALFYGGKVRRSCWADGYYLLRSKNGCLVDEDGKKGTIDDYEISATDWEIVEEPEPKFNLSFGSAIKAIRKGGVVRNSNWQRGLYMTLDKDVMHKCVIFSHKAEGRNKWLMLEAYHPSLIELESNNWELYNGNKKMGARKW